MHRQITRQFAQDLSVVQQLSWPWPKERRNSTSSILLNSLLSSFIFSCNHILPPLSGFVRSAGSFPSRSFINWDRALRSRCSEVFGAFFATVSIVAGSARFNQRITNPAFSPAGGRAAHLRE